MNGCQIDTRPSPGFSPGPCNIIIEDKPPELPPEHTVPEPASIYLVLLGFALLLIMSSQLRRAVRVNFTKDFYNYMLLPTIMVGGGDKYRWLHLRWLSGAVIFSWERVRHG